MNEDDLQIRLDLAIDAAREAGRQTLEHFGQANLHVELKDDASPVTVADRQAEQTLRSRIQAKLPDDGILGEEFGETPGTSGYRWILDPIDGTQSFVHGVPLYGTLVGVEYERRSIVGIIMMPALDEYIYAAKGQGTWYVRGDGEPQPTRVSSVDRLADGLLVSTSVKVYDQTDRRAAFDQLCASAGMDRCWGDCYGYLLVATGRAEVMVDPIMSVWDAAPLQPILEEAGGTFTDWQGNPTIHGGEGIATNGHVLDEVLAITRDTSGGRRRAE